MKDGKDEAIIQRQKRHKIVRGKRLPGGVRKVDRSSKWGNPYRIGKTYGDYAHMPYIIFYIAGHTWRSIDMEQELTRRDAVELYLATILRQIITGARAAAAGGPDTAEHFYSLKWLMEADGLACWCSLDELCHADVLIEIIYLVKRGEIDLVNGELKDLFETVKKSVWPHSH